MQEDKVISYINFNSPEEFEEWQKEPRSIINVSPFLQEFDMSLNDTSSISQEAKAHTNVGVFVTYWKEK